MCFIKWGSLVGSCYFEQQIIALREKKRLVGDFFANRKLFAGKGIVSGENAKFQVFCTETHFGGIKIFLLVRMALRYPKAMVLRQTFHQPTSLLSCQAMVLLHFSTQPTLISPFRRNNITCTLPFNRLLAALSPHCNFDFPQNRILRLYHSFPFAPVQNMAVRVCGTNKLLQKILMR